MKLDDEDEMQPRKFIKTLHSTTVLIVLQTR